mmetsp:Transcript_79272/g.158312  ORF Transcript_79272/g.158312 Transcript_79272/m.158312 type:complete len:445 (+) Transcript_79272:23-1357(+)
MPRKGSKLEKPIEAAVYVPTRTPITATCVPRGGADTLASAAATFAQLSEGVNNLAFGFDATALFCQVVAIWLTLQALYRSKQPVWSTSLLVAVVGSLTKYIIVRLLCNSTSVRSLTLAKPLPRSTRELVDFVANNSRVLVTAGCALALFIAAMVQLANAHAPFTVLYVFGPEACSQFIFSVPIPPLCDLSRPSIFAPRADSSLAAAAAGVKSPTRENSEAVSSHLAALCFRVVLFRVCEGCYMTTVLPLLLQEDCHLYFSSKLILRVSVFTGITTLVLLLAETLVLNRLQLLLECRYVGCWKRVGAAPDLEEVEEWEPMGPRVAGCKSVAVSERGAGGYARGAVVSHDEFIWEAAGCSLTRCRPGDSFAWYAHMLLHFESGHPRTSPVLLGCAGVLVLTMASQLFLILFSSQWVPFAALFFGSSAGMVLINSSMAGSTLNGHHT